MCTVRGIHYSRPLPTLLKHEIPARFNALCQSFTFGSDVPVPEDTEILIGDPQLLEKTPLPSLKVLIVPFAGVKITEEVRDALSERHTGLSILNLHHNCVPTAETGVSLLLAAAKLLPTVDRRLRTGDWARDLMDKQVILRNKTVLILGYGRVGRQVAAACKGLGMRVKGLRSSISDTYEDDIGTEVFPLSCLDKLLPSSTVLLSCLPLTPATRGLIHETRLNLLPDKAVVVNIGRGPVFHEKALFQALKEGKLFSAGLDVWWNYYPSPGRTVSGQPSEEDFGSLENVVMSPHRGGAVGHPEVEQQKFQDIEHIIKEINSQGWEAIKNHPNIVDISKGY